MASKAAAEEIRRAQILGAAFEVAAREGIGGVTLRAVATEAELSHALVLFYFGRKDALVSELLDWLVATTPRPALTDAFGGVTNGLDRLHALLQVEMSRVLSHPRRTRLFMEFWALGAKRPQIRLRIGEELARYRASIRTAIERLLEAEPSTFGGATSEGLAAVAVSWIQGCAVQAMSDPDGFDTEAYLAAVRVLVRQLGGVSDPIDSGGTIEDGR